MQRSFGVWHTKCFPKISPPTQAELESLCEQIGFANATDVKGRLIDMSTNNTESHSAQLIANNTLSDPITVEFSNFNATKFVLYHKYSPVKLNDKFTTHLKPSQPLVKLLHWDKSDKEKCFKLEIQCE